MSWNWEKMGFLRVVWYGGGFGEVEFSGISSPGVISVRVREEGGVHTDCTTHTSTVDTLLNTPSITFF